MYGNSFSITPEKAGGINPQHLSKLSLASFVTSVTVSKTVVLLYSRHSEIN